jgi:nucleotide-binding universal stress UspA family protein
MKSTAPQIGMPLLIPFDGSVPAEAVFPYVALLASGSPDIILLQVVSEAQAVSGPLGEVLLSAEDLHQVAVAAADEDLARAAERLRALIPGANIDPIIETGEPSERIVEIALQHQVGAILLANQGTSATGPGGFGSVASRVVGTSPVPVILVPPAFGKERDDTIGRLIVAHDGSERSAKVLPLVQDLARQTSAHVHIITVVEDEESAIPASVAASIEPHLHEEARGDALNSARQRLEATGASLLRQGLPASWQVLSGPAAAAILNACEHHDVLVITSHGKTGSRWVLGSVADRLVRQCPVPLVLLRTPPDAESPVSP